jgi:phosphatidylinositol alpha-mannosyltransferase
MKIAVVSFYLPPHDRIGSGVQTHHLANAYVRAGHSVTMFSPYESSDSEALYDLRRVACGNRNRTVQFAWNLRKANFKDFDLIHAGMDDWLLFGIDKPYHIRTFHGSCFAEAQVATNLKSRIRMTWLGLTEWVSCLVADKTVAVSVNTLKFIPFCKTVIWNGIDTELFFLGTEKSDNPTILFVGILDSRKRGQELLKAFVERVRVHIPDAELWLVRETKDPQVDGVRCFGNVTTSELAELYRRAWLFCLPSSYEGFGVPYIEAMACGTPVVATPNLGALEVTDNGKYGHICSLESLGEVIVDLLQSEDDRNFLVARGLERVANVSWDRLVLQYLSLSEQSGSGKSV